MNNTSGDWLIDPLVDRLNKLEAALEKAIEIRIHALSAADHLEVNDFPILAETLRLKIAAFDALYAATKEEG